jgi:heterotetrameric sarcosine oxidase gamma subunit
MLQTTSEISFTSPLAATLKGKKAVSNLEIAESVGLADLSGQAIWHIRGKNAASALRKVPSAVSDVISEGDSLIAQPRADQYFVIGAKPDAESNSEADVLTVTDLTHAYGHLLLIGKYAADVLAKVCALNFSDSAFPNNHIAQTSLAKVRASIIRHDQNDVLAYQILVGYPVTAYVWDVFFDATQEFDGQYITVK